MIANISSKKIKTFFKLLIFIIIGFEILVKISYILIPERHYSTSGWEGETDRYRGFYSLPERCLDYLVLGNSHSYHSVNPMQIYALTGFTGYNLGNSCQSKTLSYYWLLEACKYQAPRYVFLDIGSLLYAPEDTYEEWRLLGLLDMKPSLLKLQAIRDASTSKDLFYSLIFPLYRFHSRWPELNKDDFSEYNSSNYYIKGSSIFFGQNSLLHGTEKEDRAVEHYYSSFDTNIHESLNDYRINEIEALYFEKITDFCSQNNIELIPTKFPTADWTKEKAELVESYINSLGLSILDLTEDINFNWQYDTHDAGSHTNYWGATKTSYYLANFLSAKGTLINHKDDPAYAAWNEDWLGYSAWETEQLLTDAQKSLRYLNFLQDIKERYYIMISVKENAIGSQNHHIRAALRNLGLQTDFSGENLQNSFIAVIDGGNVIFEKWDNQRMWFESFYADALSQEHYINITSAGFAYGNVSIIQVDNVEYSLNNCGLNVVVMDKANGTIASSVSINTSDPELKYHEKLFSDSNSDWSKRMFDYGMIKDGYYQFTYYTDTDFDSSKHFIIKHLGNGLYAIQDPDTGKYMSVKNGETSPEKSISFDVWNDMTTQKWHILQNEDSSYTIYSLYNGQVLNVGKLRLENQSEFLSSMQSIYLVQL